MKTNRILRSAGVLLLVTVLTSALWSGMTMARYTARTNVQASARVARFGIGNYAANFNNRSMIYWHRGFYGAMAGGLPTWNPGLDFRMNATNESEVAVNMRVRFFTTIQHNAVNWPNFDWQSTQHRREIEYGIAGVGTGFPDIVNPTGTDPRIGWLRAYVNGVQREYVYNVGVFVAPGETVQFAWSLVGHTRFEGTERQWINDFDGRGQINIVFRINYDIIATQVD